MLIFTIAYGFYSLNKYSKEKNYTTAKVLLIQSNVDPWNAGVIDSIKTSMKITRDALKKINEKPDIIIWSESILGAPYYLDRPNEFYRKYPKGDSFADFIKEIDTNFLTGAVFSKTKKK